MSKVTFTDEWLEERKRAGLRVTEKFSGASAPAPAPEPKKRASKYNATKVPDPEGGKPFDSKAEKKHADQFRLLLKAKQIRCYGRQPKFILPGGLNYTADHLVIHMDGTIEVFDTKGLILPDYVMRRTLLTEDLSAHGIHRFTEIRGKESTSWPK